LEAANQADQERPTTIIFLTDGLATEGIVETSLLLSSVKEQTPQNVRLFAFGVGDDVDTFLLDSLSQNHGGTTTYVRPGQPIDEAVSSFYAKVSTPVLANISLDYDGIMVEQVYPQALPDLFAGTQLVLAGRYRDGGPATITLTGEVNGREQSFTYEDNSFRNDGGDEFIPRLWATRAIGSLLTQIRLHGEDPELVQSVVDLSIRYGIITPYTSYLIEEDDIFSQAGRRTIVEEAEEAFAAPAPASGGQAVDMAADQAEMAVAEAPLTESATVLGKDGEVRTVKEVVQSVGNKTFVYRNGVWIDTLYNADRQQPQQVGFADESYFKLLTAAPEIGQYLALGPRVLFIIDDLAYEIVEGSGQSTITLPEAQPVEPSPPAANPNDDEVDQPGNTPQVDPTNIDNQGTAGDQENTGLCASAVIAPLFIAGIGFFSFRKKRSSDRASK
jgi:Ca-activated chloride channel family protein